jgi:hypothetical protein
MSPDDRSAESDVLMVANLDSSITRKLPTEVADDTTPESAVLHVAPDSNAAPQNTSLQDRLVLLQLVNSNLKATLQNDDSSNQTHKEMILSLRGEKAFF